MSDSQLARLAKPFPARFIHDNPSGGGSYVKHSVVTEKLLAVVGPFDFELVEVIRGAVPAIPPNPNGKSDRAKNGAPALADCVVGAVCRLRVVIDGRSATVEEVGDCESPHNWVHDGARLKDAMSDALKRCAMRLGVTLHLWSQHEFSLYDQIKDDTGAGSLSDTASSPGSAGTSDGNDLSGPASVLASKIRIHDLQARLVLLQNGGYKVSGDRTKYKLPPLKEGITEDDASGWNHLLNAQESLQKPFEATQ